MKKGFKPNYPLNRKNAIFNTLVNLCGKTLTPDVIDELLNKIVYEMEEGGCSWAFQQKKKEMK